MTQHPVSDPDRYQNNDTIFGKILRGEIPADVVHEDEHCLAFRDIDPQAPVHIVIIPKRHIAKLSDADIEDRVLLGHLLHVASKIAESEGLEGQFRININNGEKAGQLVFHLHVHLLGGRDFGWPPG